MQFTFTKSLLLSSIFASILFLAGCSASISAPGPGVSTCYVRDLAGRSWNYTSAGNACVGALRACQRWHVRHGIYNGRCMVQ